MGTPGLGVQGAGYPEAGSWSASVGWRFQHSDRHFVGSEYQEERDEQASQVINDLNMADLSIRYQATKRVELSLGVPYVMATRSQSIRQGGVLLERYSTQARGIGDAVLSARRWMFNPETHLGGNLQLGVGVKIPTGANNVTDTFRVLQSGTINNVIRTVDQSIQPGDGGFGIMVDYSLFKSVAGGKVSVYSSGAYLSNPQETSKVPTYRGGAGERIMSIADQYLLRGGAAFAIPGCRTSLRPRASASRAFPCTISSAGASGSGVRESLCRLNRRSRSGGASTVSRSVSRSRSIATDSSASGTRSVAATATPRSPTGC
jgi:hypothetical protein